MLWVTQGGRARGEWDPHCLCPAREPVFTSPFEAAGPWGAESCFVFLPIACNNEIKSKLWPRRETD